MIYPQSNSHVVEVSNIEAPKNIFLNIFKAREGAVID